MSFTCLRYHITFATKCRRPLIRDEHEPVVHAELREACKNQDGRLLEIGGIPDHVHLLAGVPPTSALSTFIKEIKRQSTIAITEAVDGLGNFAWQKRYSAFTVSEWDMRRIFHYVRNQHRRHDDGDVWEEFEPAIPS